MKFIRFKQLNGSYIAVNPSLIVSIRLRDDGKGTVIRFNDGKYVEVTENFDTVLIRINDAL